MTLALEIPLHGSQLIEASAGTGKTYTIALLYVRLILEDLACDSGRHTTFERSLLPPDILVVTFTNAAAGELRTRIRQRLVETAAAFAGDYSPPADDPLTELLCLYDQEEHLKCARRLTLAAAWMDQAAISTIHAWALKMLQEHAFDSGSVFEQKLVPDQSARIREVVRDYWRTHFSSLDFEQASVIDNLFGDGPDALQKRLTSLLKWPDATLTYAGETVFPGRMQQILGSASSDFARLHELENNAKNAYAINGEEICQRLRTLRPTLNGNSFRGKDDDSTFNSWLAELDDWANTGDQASDFIKKLGRSRIRLNRGGIRPPEEFFDCIDTWLDVTEEIDEERSKLHGLVQADACQWVTAQLQKELLERGELGFDDLLRQLNTALGGDRGVALAERIRARFPVALIDEFQDTDPVQYQLFEQIYRIARDDPKTVIILIGDPKQAIYSFRGADIHTYLEVRQATAGRHHSLAKNFRSTLSMVDAVNQLFASAEQFEHGAFRYKTESGNPVPYTRVEAQHRKERLTMGGSEVAALNTWLLSSEKAVTAVPHRTIMAAHAAEQIVCWLNDPDSGFKTDDSFKQLQPADIAILVRDGSEAKAVGDALRARRITSVYLSDRDSVFTSDEARDLLRWLQACATPDDDNAVREALATATLNLPLTTLDALRDDELKWEQQQQRFISYRSRWVRYGVLPTLRSLLHEYQVPQQLLARADGERRLTNLLQLMEWAQQMAATLDGEQALIRVLAEHIVDPSEQEQILRLESDAELIQIVTIHKSKGLEYPIVVLPFASGYKPVDGKKKDIHLHDVNGRRVELAGLDLAREAYRMADEERLAEDVRLLYVALTRACHATFLGVANVQGMQKGALGYLLGGGEAFADTEAIRTRIDALSAHAGAEVISLTAVDLNPCVTSLAPRGEGEVQRAAEEPDHRPFLDWWVASYSALTSRLDEASPAPEPETRRDADRDEELNVLDTENDNTIESRARPANGTIHAFPRGPEPGTFLHGLIEWAGDRGFAASLTDPERMVVIERRCRVRGWLGHAATVDHWLQKFLNAQLPCNQGSLIQLSTLARYRVEQDFSFAVHNAGATAVDEIVSSSILPGHSRRALSPNKLNGLVTGFIDLVAEHDGHFYVIDWKSNYLGPTDDHYTQEVMTETMLAKRYDVQLCLYLLALHRHLRQRLTDYDYDRHIGGAMFVFLRGIGAESRGVCQHKPDRACIEALDALMRSGQAAAESIA